MNYFITYQQKVKEYQQRVIETNRKYLERLAINLKDPSPIDIIKLNAFISCSGVTVEDKNVMKELIRIAMGEEPEKRTGNVGISILYGKDFGLDMRSVAPTEEAYAKIRAYTLASPIKIIKSSEAFYLGIGNIPITEVEILPAPRWYNERLPNGLRKNSVFQDELRNLMGAIPTLGSRQGCIYFSQGVPCKFCALQNKEKPITPKDAATVVSDAYSEFPNQTTVTMTGGNTDTVNRGIEKYIPFVEAIREEVPKVPIEIEVSPPSNPEILDQLKDAGLNSYMSNLEIWNEEIRKEVCPGKSRIPREDYLKAFKYAQELGFPTYSVLIVGLEPPESTLEGIRYFAKKGVTTIPLPFKPLENAIYQWKTPTDPSLLLRVSVEAIKIMREYKVNPMSRKTGGCSLCGGCSMEVNLDRNWQKLEAELKNAGVLYEDSKKNDREA